MYKDIIIDNIGQQKIITAIPNCQSYGWFWQYFSAA